MVGEAGKLTVIQNGPWLRALPRPRLASQVSGRQKGGRVPNSLKESDPVVIKRVAPREQLLHYLSVHKPFVDVVRGHQTPQFRKEFTFFVAHTALVFLLVWYNSFEREARGKIVKHRGAKDSLFVC